MPTVIEFGGLRVMVRTNDHNPPHVHVVGAGAEARFQIDVTPVVLMSSHGFSKRAIKKIAAALNQYRDDLMDNWRAIHDEE